MQSEEKGLLYVWGTLHEANGKHTQKVRAETQNLKKENRKKNHRKLPNWHSRHNHKRKKQWR